MGLSQPRPQPGWSQVPDTPFPRSHQGRFCFSGGICALSRLECYLSFGHPTKSLSTCHGMDTGLDPGNKTSGAQTHRGHQAPPHTVQYRMGALPPPVKGTQGSKTLREWAHD